jgi:hypothetical protein
MTDENMTLLEAVESLEFIEVAAVSWINIIPIQKQVHYMAYFQIAFGLPFLDTKLPNEFRAGVPRFWPDQKRLLKSRIPIENQILELHETGMLGDLASIYLPPMEGKSLGLWTIETHAASNQNRLRWIEDVIALEGRELSRHNPTSPDISVPW